MTANTPLPAIRTSDAERERIVTHLRERVVEGRLSTDSFIARIERVYQARNRVELADIVRDLPPQGRLTRAATECAHRMSAFVAEVKAAWRGPRLPLLSLPDRAERITVGRSRDRDLVLSDPTASRHHAELRRVADGWLLVDQGAKNGTRVNGVRVYGSVTVRTGDSVTFGRTTFRLVRR